MIWLTSVYHSIWVRLFRYIDARRFRSFGRNVYVFPGCEISAQERIEVGDDVVIQSGSVLHGGDAEDAILRIGRGSNIGRRNHIFSYSQIIIEEKVLTAGNVYISDCTHTYYDPKVPIIDQNVRPIGKVIIGSGTWIGQNSCIIGCRIGRNCVIGANSVVMQDVPDNCVVVGAPSRIIKRFDIESGDWANV